MSGFNLSIPKNCLLYLITLHPAKIPQFWEQELLTTHQVSTSEWQKGHLRQTFVTLLFSLFLSFLSKVAIPTANSSGDTKKIRQGTKPTYNPLQILSEAHKEVKQNTCQEFSSYLDLEWLSNSQVCSFDN